MVNQHRDAADKSSCGGTDLARIFRIYFGMAALHHAERAVAYANFAWLAIQFEKQRSRPVGMRFAYRKELDDHGLAGLNLDGDFFTRFQAVEKSWRRENAHVRIGLPEMVVLQKYFRVKKIAEHGVPAYRVTHFFLQCCAFHIPIRRGEAGAGPALQRRLAAKDNAL